MSLHIDLQTHESCEVCGFAKYQPATAEQYRQALEEVDIAQFPSGIGTVVGEKVKRILETECEAACSFQMIGDPKP